MGMIQELSTGSEFMKTAQSASNTDSSENISNARAPLQHQDADLRWNGLTQLLQSCEKEAGVLSVCCRDTTRHVDHQVPPWPEWAGTTLCMFSTWHKHSCSEGAQEQCRGLCSFREVRTGGTLFRCSVIKLSPQHSSKSPELLKITLNTFLLTCRRPNLSLWEQS